MNSRNDLGAHPTTTRSRAIITCALGLILTQGAACSRFPHQASGDAGRWAAPSPTRSAALSPNTAPNTAHPGTPVGAPASTRNSGNESAYIAGVEPGSVRTRRTFDPLWIESAASAERRRPGGSWSPYNTTVVTYTGQTAGAPSNDPHNYSNSPALRTGGLDVGGAAAAASSTGWIDDGPEGLTHVTNAPEGADFDPCISRDGQFMVFASTQHRATSDIYFKRVDGRTITQLTADPAHDVMPAISPDGKRVAFCSNRRGNWDIFVMSISGGQAVQITSEQSHELHPTWSPDGRKIAFCRLGETSGRWELWVTDADGSTTNEFIGYGLFPQWCPVAATGEKGRDKILFQRSRERGDRAFSIWSIDYKPGDTSSPTEIVSSPGAALINAGWSPDGRSIVYATVENPDRSSFDPATGRSGANADLWITGIDGTGRVALTSGRHLNLMPAWSSDGRVYFVSDRSGTSNIWSLGTEKAMLAAGSPGKNGRTNTAGAPAPAEEPVAAAPEHQDTETANVPSEGEANH